MYKARKPRTEEARNHLNDKIEQAKEQLKDEPRYRERVVAVSYTPKVGVPGRTWNGLIIRKPVSGRTPHNDVRLATVTKLAEDHYRVSRHYNT